MSFLVCSSTFADAKIASEYKDTANDHVHALMFFLMNKLWTVSVLLHSCPLSRSIKCITQMSESNLGFFSTSTHAVLLCKGTLQAFSFSGPVWTVLGQCYFVTRTNYCLSCVMRALYISCYSLTCGRKGLILFHVCG